MFLHIRPKQNRGFAILGILLALAIILILSGHYFTKDEASQKTYVETQIDKSTDAACAANRRTLEGSVSAWQVSHFNEQPTAEKLRKARYSVPRCPDGPEYIITPEGNVYCPVHYPPPGKAHERSNAQSEAGRIQPGSQSGGASGPAAIDRVNRQLNR